MLAAIGLLIPIGYFLFNVENDHKCHAANDYADFAFPDRYQDVDHHFRVILILFFTVYLVDGFAYLLLLIGIIAKSTALMTLATILLIPNFCLSIASMIVMHVWRYNLAG